jgi:hypothetical protein
MEFDPHVAKLSTAEECEQFIENVREKHPELVPQAKRRAVQLRAEKAGAKSEVEREALEAIYAYETVLSEHSGKKKRATRTWQMIKNHGIIGTIERAVNRPDDASGYTTLVSMGWEQLSFEAVVLRHREVFSPEIITRCKERLERYRQIV